MLDVRNLWIFEIVDKGLSSGQSTRESCLWDSYDKLLDTRCRIPIPRKRDVLVLLFCFLFVPFSCLSLCLSCRPPWSWSFNLPLSRLLTSQAISHCPLFHICTKLEFRYSSGWWLWHIGTGTEADCILGLMS